MGTGALLSSATLKASQSLHSVLRRMSTAKSEAPTAGLIFRASATSADPSCLSLWRAVLSSFRVATSTSLIACTAGLPKVQLSVMSHAGRCEWVAGGHGSRPIWRCCPLPVAPSPTSLQTRSGLQFLFFAEQFATYCPRLEFQSSPDSCWQRIQRKVP